MKILIWSFFLVVMLVSLVSCQPAATPVATVTTLATEPSQPTVTPVATLKPTVTPLPTSTTVPICGNVALPQTDSLHVDISKSLAKFEPPDNQIYFGFSFRIWDEPGSIENAKWGDTRPFQERICDSVKYELSGKTPTFLVFGVEWTSPFIDVLENIHRIEASLGPSVTPLVDWHANESANTKSIAAGNFDEYIMRFARDVKLYNKPIFIRLLCGGFNGDWDPGCSRGAGRDLTREDFINAWRRVVDIFRQEGVTNVAWIWAPAIPVPPSLGDWGWDTSWYAYYPGDEYVDWVGGGQGGWGDSSWINPVYQFGVAHHKPFLFEFGIRHIAIPNMTHQQLINWLTEMFDYFDNHSKIKAISFSNVKNLPDSNPTSADHIILYDGKVNYLPDTNDFDSRLLAGGEDIRALFADRIADSRYISVLSVGP